MSARIVRPRVVERDLAELTDYLGRTNPDVGRRFLIAAEETFQRLAAMPHLGSPWEPAGPRLADLRFAPVRGFKNHLVLYRPIQGGIAVVRVLHGARDIEGLLGK